MRPRAHSGQPRLDPTDLPSPEVAALRVKPAEKSGNRWVGCRGLADSRHGVGLLATARRIAVDDRNKVATVMPWTDVAPARVQLRDPGAVDGAVPFSSVQPGQVRDRFCIEALTHFARSPEADTKAEVVRAAKMHIRHLHFDTDPGRCRSGR